MKLNNFHERVANTPEHIRQLAKENLDKLDQEHFNELERIYTPIIKENIKKLTLKEQSEEYFENYWKIWWDLMGTDQKNGLLNAIYQIANQQKTEVSRTLKILPEVSICGLSARIKDGEKVIIVDIPDYRTDEELNLIIKNVLINYTKMNQEIEAINNKIKELNTQGVATQYVSDGYHTFDELYEFRKMYNAALFNEWAQQPKEKGFVSSSLDWKYNVKYDVHKSWKHHDGEKCFGGGWFIVSAMLPTGLISNHYKAADWDLFKVPEVEKAKYPFDGHTGKDVLERLKAL